MERSTNERLEKALPLFNQALKEIQEKEKEASDVPWLKDRGFAF